MAKGRSSNVTNANWQTDNRGEPISDETAKRIAEMLLAMARKKLSESPEKNVCKKKPAR